MVCVKVINKPYILFLTLLYNLKRPSTYWDIYNLWNLQTIFYLYVTNKYNTIVSLLNTLFLKKHFCHLRVPNKYNAPLFHCNCYI